MRYYSTRSATKYVTSAQAIKEGLAEDGGLYVPSEKPLPFNLAKLPGGDYQNIASTIFRLYLTDYDQMEIDSAIRAAYSSNIFDHPGITPLRKLNSDLYFLELWHGPTSAFKDIALQILPYLLRTAIKITREEAELVILTATSGDTGKSALEGFRDVDGIKIVVYFPVNGVSEVQKLQMITQEGENVSVAAINGNFDDTQNGVKNIFNDRDLSKDLAGKGYRLSSANSINWGRLLPQIVYYFYAYSELVMKREIAGGEKVNFVVPTGNFGNILAGYYARQLGLPINRLICAANRNNVLSDFISSGHYNINRKLQPSISPSMDILLSSNLERLLFELTGHDTKLVGQWMESLKRNLHYQVDKETLKLVKEIFWSDYADDEETKYSIAETYRDFNYLIDTHTAVGRSVLNKYRTREKDFSKTVILSTASPYKFTGSVVGALFDNQHYRGLPELDLMKILSDKTGTGIPLNLAGLEQKKIIHEQVIKVNEMSDHLLDFLKLSQRS